MNWHTHCNLIIISRRGFPRRVITRWCPDAIEADLLQKMPVFFDHCPHCGETPFVPYVRGKIQRPPWSHPVSWLLATMQGKVWPYCALICRVCSHLVAWEWVAKEVGDV